MKNNLLAAVAMSAALLLTAAASTAQTPAAPATVESVPTQANDCGLPPEQPAPAAATKTGDTAAGTAPAAEAKPQETPPPQLQGELPPKQCAGGKIKIERVTGEYYGSHIGDNILYNVVITVAKDAQLNLEPLKRRKLALDKEGNTQFEMAAEPLIQIEEKADSVQYDIMLTLRQFVLSPTLSVWVEIPYAVAKAPDGSPIWQMLVTPKYTLVQYVDGVPKLQRPMVTGNVAGVAPRGPWALPAMAVLCVVLILCCPALVALRWMNRVRPRKQMSREMAAWLSWCEIKRSGSRFGYSLPLYQEMGKLLRKHLAPVYPGIQGMTLPQIEDLPDDERTSLVKSVFRKLNGALVEEEPLSAGEVNELVAEVDALIKRPFTV